MSKVIRLETREDHQVFDDAPGIFDSCRVHPGKNHFRLISGTAVTYFPDQAPGYRLSLLSCRLPVEKS
jgi:hypothetical protein